ALSELTVMFEAVLLVGIHAPLTHGMPEHKISDSLEESEHPRNNKALAFLRGLRFVWCGPTSFQDP
ncbi:hypothetical protein, partial [Pseudomonas asplenii]|uniref:hypothetical protein n=1 Tax=Pseudomonas asplenii TaxID=53407 RepID=UPI001ED8C45F